jgi:hypothetical protein
VPPDTETWAEAVTHGFYGERTDPLPDEVYQADFDSGDLPWALDSVSPAEQSVMATGAWSVVATGTFPAYDPNRLKLELETGLEGRVWPTLDVTGRTLNEFTAHYTEGPWEAAAEGVGAAVLMYAGAEQARVPFTWTA